MKSHAPTPSRHVSTAIDVEDPKEFMNALMKKEFSLRGSLLHDQQWDTRFMRVSNNAAAAAAAAAAAVASSFMQPPPLLKYDSALFKEMCAI